MARLIEQFFKASRENDTQTIFQLLKAPSSESSGLHINSKSSMGRTALHKACEFHNVDMATTLIENGANMNVKCKLGRTPLQFMSMHGDLEACVSMIIKGAELAERDIRGRNALEIYGTGRRSKLTKAQRDEHKRVLERAYSVRARKGDVMKAVLFRRTATVLKKRKSDSSYTDSDRDTDSDTEFSLKDVESQFSKLKLNRITRKRVEPNF